ncbi:protein MAINTENANCE OF MERISTEMS-like [Gossypium hirsutum]|uniref:Protein MAINTENANCE OF MERISTEMS-like n=1 Tax=Gossypium hirsutum TaxID=3635 RepID=A0A1U8ITG1_GOSHI|nr:protein MAINTENANCE OF MERISTEMS-like [Gossypium hirsutum]
MSYFELARFRSAVLIWTFDLWYDLISTLVERWRLKTHTLHLLCGQCTITLEDVTLQLELPFNGSTVTGISAISKPVTLCYNLLGVSLDDAELKFLGLRFSWLKANFKYLPINVTERDVMCAARAYIMHIIGGVLMSDANNNELGFRSTSYVVSRAFSDKKSFCYGHRWMPHIVAVLGNLPDAILGVG